MDFGGIPVTEHADWHALLSFLVALDEKLLEQHVDPVMRAWPDPGLLRYIAGMKSGLQQELLGLENFLLFFVEEQSINVFSVLNVIITQEGVQR